MSVTIIRTGRRKKAHIITEWAGTSDFYLSPCGLGWSGRKVHYIKHSAPAIAGHYFVKYDDPEEVQEAIEHGLQTGVMCRRCVRNTS